MIIGFTGKMRTGKTEAAKCLTGFTSINFKDRLIFEITNNFPDLLSVMKEQYSMNISDLFIHKPPLIRALMQNYGTDVRRKDDQDYWVKIWREFVDTSFDNVSVDDVRFINEAKAIKDNGGYIIRIKRDGEISGNHQSETETDSIKEDFLIENNGTIEDLWLSVQTILYGIRRI